MVPEMPKTKGSTNKVKKMGADSRHKKLQPDNEQTEGQREISRIEDKYEPKLAPFLGKFLQPGSQEYKKREKIMARRDAEMREWGEKYLVEPPKQWTREEFLAPLPDDTLQELDKRIKRALIEIMWLGTDVIQKIYVEGIERAIELRKKNPTFSKLPRIESDRPATKLDLMVLLNWCTENQQAEAGQPTETGGDKAGDTKEQVKLSKEQEALAILVKYPDWTNKQIAQRIGVHEKSLSRWPVFQSAREAQKTGRKDFPNGSKDGQTGDLEAW